MIVLSRDKIWLLRLERLAFAGGWPFEGRSVIPSQGRTPPPERALVVLDRGLAGVVPKKTISLLRSFYPSAAVALSFDANEMSHEAAMAAVSCGADDVIGKSWSDDKLSLRLAALRDRALAAQTRLSADGRLKAERRSHRVFVMFRGRWKEIALDASGFSLVWRLLECEGVAVSLAELRAALAAVTGREFETGSVTRRLATLKKSLAAWPGAIESERGGFYRLVSAS